MAAGRHGGVALNINVAARRDDFVAADWHGKRLPMTWLVFAFSGPVLWAISTHWTNIVEKYFKQGDVAMRFSSQHAPAC